MDDDDDNDNDNQITAAAVAMITLAIIAAVLGCYLLFFKEGFCFNTGKTAGPKEVEIGSTA